MKERKFTKWQGLIYIIVIAVIFGGCVSICKDDNNGFKQVGYFKSNESPYTRIFSVYTEVTDIDSLAGYARKKPFTDGGFTTVLFFNNKENTPDVTFSAWNYDESKNDYLVFKFVKKGNGVEELTEY